MFAVHKSSMPPMISDLLPPEHRRTFRISSSMASGNNHGLERTLPVEGLGFVLKYLCHFIQPVGL